MNLDNVGTLEACQRLQAAGIVLETEKSWYLPTYQTDYILIDTGRHLFDERIPAPSPAEVWRLLPVGATLEKAGNCYHAFIAQEGRKERIIRDNPTDALIDLLILVTEQTEGGEDDPKILRR